MKKLLAGLVVASALSCVLPCAAQNCTSGTVSVAVSPSNGGSCSITQVNGRQQVLLERNSGVSGTVEFLVTGASTETFDRITVATNNSADLTTVRVRRSTSGQAVTSVEAILKTGTGPVTLDELRLSGNLGEHLTSGPAVDVDTINTFIVGGDVLGAMSVVNDSFNSSSAVTGSFLGNLTVLRGSVINLPVTGDIGAPSAPVSITVDGDAILITARAIHALTSVTGAVQTYRATGESTTGVISGSLTGRWP